MSGVLSPSSRTPSRGDRSQRPLPVITPGVPVSAKHVSMPPPAVAPGVLSVNTARTNQPMRLVQDDAAQKRLSSGTKLSWASEGLAAGQRRQQQIGGNVRMSVIERDIYDANEAGDSVDRDFDKLLDKLQVAPSLRAKLAPLESPIKQSILESSQSSRSVLPMPPPSPARKAPRKAKSSTSLRTDARESSHNSADLVTIDSDQFIMVTPEHRGSARGQSLDVHRPTAPNGRPKQSKASIFASMGANASLGRASGSGFGTNKDKGKEDPQTFVKLLTSARAVDMDVNRVKTLRMLLRHESTQWVQDFVYADGYKHILSTLQQLLDVEWREEQHDDQLLYELLRCIKALSTSEIGKQALRHSSPYPWQALSALLFSEKKPGDLPTRQIILDLWVFLFELFPAGSAKDQEIPMLVRQLLIPELDDPTKDHHEFVKVARRPRVFKAWVGEMSDICRDYFWIMCHGSNQFWALEEVDEAKVERPVAPGGATGGVEYEAMNYVTTHFRLLNTLSRAIAAQDPQAAKQMHDDLMQSGMDRILVTIRKASTSYYPTIHLELARYVAEAKKRGSLPMLIERLIASPPDEVRRFGLGGRTERGEWLPMPVTPRGGWDMQS